MSSWQAQLAALEDELTRQLPSEYGARFAAAVADYVKGQVRRSPEPEAAFRAALERLIDSCPP